MRKIVESIPVGLFIFKLAQDGTLILSDVNAAADNMSNMAVRDQIGKSFEEAFPFLVETGTGEILKKIARDGTEWYNEEFQMTGPDSIRVFEVNAFQIAQDEVATALVDVTKRKEIEKILELENEKLKEIDKMRKDFVSTTTHELKTPLSSLIGACEFLIKEYKSLQEAEVLNLIEIVHRSSLRLKSMINDLLVVNRIEENLMVLEIKDVDMVTLVGQIIKDTAYLFKHRIQDLDYELPETCIARVDPFRIEQVITNLLQNACKNTPPYGKVRIAVLQDDQWELLVSVTDTGVGLLPGEIGQLFQKFGKLQRPDVDTDIEISGTGLGLFISKMIIEAHGGTIWAESEGRDEGSTFTFAIPRNANAGAS